jgi:hypothetical protein
MMNFTYHENAKSEMYQRQAGLRRAQLNGTAYEPRSRRQLPWPWRRSRPADPRNVRLEPGIQGR